MLLLENTSNPEAEDGDDICPVDNGSSDGIDICQDERIFAICNVPQPEKERRCDSSPHEYDMDGICDLKQKVDSTNWDLISLSGHRG